MKFYWEVIADKLSKAGWSWGCVATVDARGTHAHKCPENPADLLVVAVIVLIINLIQGRRGC